MVYGRFAKGKEDLETVWGISHSVFVDELGFAKPEEDEEFILSALVFAEGEAAGAGHLVFDGPVCRITEAAVLPEYRGEEYGDFLVRLLVEKARMSGVDKICLDALSGTERFFEKIGFCPEGEMFEKSGGLWQPMVLSADDFTGCKECGKVL